MEVETDTETNFIVDNHSENACLHFLLYLLGVKISKSHTQITKDGAEALFYYKIRRGSQQPPSPAPPLVSTLQYKITL